MDDSRFCGEASPIGREYRVVGCRRLALASLLDGLCLTLISMVDGSAVLAAAFARPIVYCNGELGCDAKR